jgi:hypothetical protein
MKRISTAAALVLLAGCMSSAPNAPDPIVVTHLAPPSRALTSALQEPSRVVIRDAATFARTWRRAFGDDAILPHVDFARQMVIVAAMGGRASGGYRIVVSDVALVEGRVVVIVDSHVPGASCAVTRATTAPVDFALVSDVPGSIEFEDRTLVTDCGAR